MNLSVVTSCLINSSGKRGDKSSGLIGSKVLGCNGGGGLIGRSATRLYHWWGTSIDLLLVSNVALTLQPFEYLRCIGFVLKVNLWVHCFSTEKQNKKCNTDNHSSSSPYSTWMYWNTKLSLNVSSFDFFYVTLHFLRKGGLLIRSSAVK